MKPLPEKGDTVTCFSKHTRTFEEWTVQEAIPTPRGMRYHLSRPGHAKLNVPASKLQLLRRKNAQARALDFI